MGGGVFNSVAVSVDNVTLEIAAGLVQIKDAGVTAAKLAAGAVDVGFIFIETITLAANATSFDFAATLDGNTDEEYLITYRFVSNVGTQNEIHLRINGATATAKSQLLEAYNTTITASAASTPFISLNYPLAAENNVIAGQTWIYAKTGFTRPFHTISSPADATSTPYKSMVVCSLLTDTSTNITSIGFVTAADGFKIGTTASLWKKGA